MENTDVDMISPENEINNNIIKEETIHSEIMKDTIKETITMDTDHQQEIIPPQLITISTETEPISTTTANTLKSSLDRKRSLFDLQMEHQDYYIDMSKLKSSLFISLYQNGYSFDNVNKDKIYSYNDRDSKILLKAINQKRLIPELIELLDEVENHYYDGCIVLNIKDYRDSQLYQQHQQQPQQQQQLGNGICSSIQCTEKRILLRPDSESLYFDIKKNIVIEQQQKQLLYNSKESFDDCLLNFEKNLLIATNSDLNLRLDNYRSAFERIQETYNRSDRSSLDFKRYKYSSTSDISHSNLTPYEYDNVNMDYRSAQYSLLNHSLELEKRQNKSPNEPFVKRNSNQSSNINPLNFTLFRLITSNQSLESDRVNVLQYYTTVEKPRPYPCSFQYHVNDDKEVVDPFLQSPTKPPIIRPLLKGSNDVEMLKNRVFQYFSGSNLIVLTYEVKVRQTFYFLNLYISENPNMYNLIKQNQIVQAQKYQLLQQHQHQLKLQQIQQQQQAQQQAQQIASTPTATTPIQSPTSASTPVPSSQTTTTIVNPTPTPTPTAAATVATVATTTTPVVQSPIITTTTTTPQISSSPISTGTTATATAQIPPTTTTTTATTPIIQPPTAVVKNAPIPGSLQALQQQQQMQLQQLQKLPFSSDNNISEITDVPLPSFLIFPMGTASESIYFINHLKQSFEKEPGGYTLSNDSLNPNQSMSYQAEIIKKKIEAKSMQQQPQQQVQIPQQQQQQQMQLQQQIQQQQIQQQQQAQMQIQQQQQQQQNMQPQIPQQQHNLQYNQQPQNIQSQLPTQPQQHQIQLQQQQIQPQQQYPQNVSAMAQQQQQNIQQLLQQQQQQMAISQQHFEQQQRQQIQQFHQQKLQQQQQQNK